MLRLRAASNPRGLPARSVRCTCFGGWEERGATAEWRDGAWPAAALADALAPAPLAVAGFGIEGHGHTLELAAGADRFGARSVELLGAGAWQGGAVALEYRALARADTSSAPLELTLGLLARFELAGGLDVVPSAELARVMGAAFARAGVLFETPTLSLGASVETHQGQGSVALAPRRSFGGADASFEWRTYRFGGVDGSSFGIGLRSSW
jgi:hypothetical protein